MNWKYLFDRDVLAEGRRLYVDGAVTLLPGMKGGFLANVLDDGVYQVSVTVSDDAVAAISCTCRAGRAGRRCRHMSAALYEVDALSDKLEEVKTQLESEDASSMDERVEFPASEAEGYQYFRLSRILKDAWITRGQLKRARDLVEQGRIRMIRFQADYHAQGRMAVTCYGELSGGDRTGCVLFDLVQGIKSARSYSDISRVFTRRGAYQDLVRVEFDAQQVLSHSCQNYNCARRQAAGLGGSMARRREEYCDHEIALMMLAQERLDRENPGDATDEKAAGLLAAFRNLRREGEDAARTVKLEPRLVLSQGSLKLSMRVGTGKMFVVRNLPAFAAAVRGADKISLGTSEEIDFSVQRFTPEAESYFELVEEFVQADAGASGDGAFYRGLGSNIGKDVVLGGVMLDRFFEAAAGREISLQEEGSSGSRKNKVRLTEGEPELHFHIRRMLDSYGEFHGIELSGKMPHLLQGSRYAYYLEKDRLCRISPETRRKLRPLSQLEENGEIRLRIGRNHLAAFYRDVLPKLRTAAVITEEDPEETQTFLPPSAEFLFYVDGEEESASCRPVVRYGTQEFDLKPGEDVSDSKLRDSWAEESALRVVQQYFPEWNAEAGVFETQEDGLYRLVEEGFRELMNVGEVQTTDRFRNIRIRRNLPMTVGVSLGNDLMELSVLSEDVSAEELREILQSYRRKKRFYRMKNGDLLDLSAPSVEELSDLMTAAHLRPEEFTGRQMQIPAFRAMYLDQMLARSQALYGVRDSRFRHLVKEFKTIDESEFEIPKGLASPLRNYQRYGYRWLRTLETLGFGGILADEMGLGKTIQMIAVILAAKEEGRPCHTLVVCPASLVYNWQEEVHRFAPSLKPLVIAGTQAEREELMAAQEQADILITSYDLLRRDLKLYEGLHFDYEVIDEAQYIKNHTTAAAKSVKVVQASHRFALTGTPIENRLSELWSIFDYLMPGFLYEYRVFREELEVPIVREQQEEASQRLRSMVSPFILRRQKKEVLKDLPEKLEQLRFAKMDREQQQVYDGQVLRMRDLLEHVTDEEYHSGRIQVLSELTRLRQICCDPSLLFEDYHGPSAKREACLELIQSAMEGGHKVLVFSQFVSMLELLEADLRRELIPYYKITGQTPKGERMEEVKAFNKDETPVFLISLRAGGTGLNLTGADVVIHYDPWWNLAVQNQATDRAHRIGQTREVSVYKLIIKDSLEEKILDMQEKKKDLAEEILAGEGSSLMTMSREELLELLS